MTPIDTDRLRAQLKTLAPEQPFLRDTVDALLKEVAALRRVREAAEQMRVAGWGENPQEWHDAYDAICAALASLSEASPVPTEEE